MLNIFIFIFYLLFIFFVENIAYILFPDKILFNCSFFKSFKYFELLIIADTDVSVISQTILIKFYCILNPIPLNLSNSLHFCLLQNIHHLQFHYLFYFHSLLPQDNTFNWFKYSMFSFITSLNFDIIPQSNFIFYLCYSINTISPNLDNIFHF